MGKSVMLDTPAKVVQEICRRANERFRFLDDGYGFKYSTGNSIFGVFLHINNEAIPILMTMEDNLLEYINGGQYMVERLIELEMETIETVAKDIILRHRVKAWSKI